MFSRKFQYLFLSQVLSQVTVQMMNFLLLTRLFILTGSSIATSLLWVAYALPAVFFGPIGAASVDIVSRRKMLMITNLLQALTVVVYIFTHQESVFLLYVVVVAYSFFNQFYVPAESASLPSVVSKEDLPKANSLFLITQQLALIVGFGMAGIVLRLLGFSGSLVLCSVFLFISFISVSFLPKLAPRKEVPESFEELLGSFFKSILEGYQFIKGKKNILFPFFLLLGVQVASAVVIVNLPSVATQILKVSVSYIGLLVVVPAALGGLLGSLLVPKLILKGFRKKRIIEYGLFLMAAPLFLITILLPALTPVLIFLVGMGFVGVNVPTLTFLQEQTPVGLRGRVFGNMWFLVTIVTIFPVIFSGVIAEFLGVKALLSTLAAVFIFALYYSKAKGQNLIEENFHG